MVQAWYMDNNTQEPQAENHRNPAKYISIEDLRNKTGVEYFQINIETYKSDNVLEGIKKERGYTYEDEMTCSDACENYQDRLKIFFTEHLHKDEEIRLVLDGEGYFDVRDADDEWIRIHVTCGDMLILPSGIYHSLQIHSHPQELCESEAFLHRRAGVAAVQPPRGRDDLPPALRRQTAQGFHTNVLMTQ